MASPDERAGTSGQEQREELDKTLEELSAGQEAGPAGQPDRWKPLGKSEAPGQRASPGKTESEDPERSANESEQGETR